jgi:allantoate deiminase
MNLRQDAFCGAAEVVLAAEKVGVLATVGQCDIENSASNVIPGRVAFTLDVRDVKDAKRQAACAKLRKFAGVVAERRGLKLSWGIVQETSMAGMDTKLTALLRKAAGRAPLLPSGAGHDAAVMSKVCPAAMLFVRCKGGISHHPDESVTQRDVAVALDVLTRTVLGLAGKHD